jgi:hypothetical protein
MKYTLITNLYYYSWLYNLESIQFRKTQDVTDDTEATVVSSSVCGLFSQLQSKKKRQKVILKLIICFYTPIFKESSCNPLSSGRRNDNKYNNFTPLHLGRKELNNSDVFKLTKFLDGIMLLMASTVIFSSGYLLNKFTHTHTHTHKMYH